MEFNPNHPVIKLLMKGMHLNETGNVEEAVKTFLQAWSEAADDFEKSISSWYIARLETTIPSKIDWYKTALEHALNAGNESLKGSFLTCLYSALADHYQLLGDVENAERYEGLALASISQPIDKGPFYHGTRAALQIGDLLTAGRTSNYQSELVMNHIYFTALVNSAGLAAALALGEGTERVYIVEPTDSFEDDPNVTNKKFPGNLTRSYRTRAPLKITGEVTDWLKQTPEQIQQWRGKLADNKGEIIN
ncbi:NAD(+)--rifampin ADP-ribosyltransferase [Pedobacter sp. PF22-3]|nr:NAD(+)--rifampin ADP-ribosyltransferase [Pedobacter sp. PF22-3]MCX2493007.1 NAD(+)--rifampin ADP-ribosyltransferase [Pedobacter sp. PF22-3]